MFELCLSASQTTKIFCYDGVGKLAMDKRVKYQICCPCFCSALPTQYQLLVNTWSNGVSVYSSVGSNLMLAKIQYLCSISQEAFCFSLRPAWPLFLHVIAYHKLSLISSLMDSKSSFCDKLC